MYLGYLTITITIIIWSGFFLSLKGGAQSLLTPADMALARFVLPSLVLFPLVWRARAEILSIPKLYIWGMFFGCGLPYLLVASTAMQYVPVANGSALIPGTLPLFVSAIAVLCFKQPLSQHRIWGLIFVIIGILLFLYSSLATLDLTQSYGHLSLLVASLMWATFTICARVADLDALVSAGMISLLSSLMLVILIGFGILPSHLMATPAILWPIEEVVTHTLLQGVGAGLIAAFTYLYSIRTLGAERSAAFGSATPAVATLLAIPIFGEVPDGIEWVALGCICVGSLIASNVFLENDQSLHYQPPLHKRKK